MNQNPQPTKKIYIYSKIEKKARHEGTDRNKLLPEFLSLTYSRFTYTDSQKSIVTRNDGEFIKKINQNIRFSSGVRECNTHDLIESISLVNDALKNLILAVACSIFGLISGMALSTPSLISPVLSVDHSLTSQDYTYFGVTARLAELPIVKRTLLRCFVTNDDSQRLGYVTRNTEMCNLATA